MAESVDLSEAEVVELAPPPRKLTLVRVLAFVVVPAAFIAFLAFGLFRSSGKDLAGQPAPEFDLPLLSGGSMKSVDLKGRPVVFNFWASWCIPCREEAKTLEAAWNRHKGEGLMIVGVNVQDSVADAQGFVDEFGLTYPSIRDTDLKLWTRFGVRGLPETFFVDHDYRFVATAGTSQEGSEGGTKILGAVSPIVLESEVKSLLQPKNQSSEFR